MILNEKNLQVKKIKRNKMFGLCANKNFVKNSVVFEIKFTLNKAHGGKVVPFVESYESYCDDRGFGITPNYSFCPNDTHPLYWLNHSCNPNLGIMSFGKIYWEKTAFSLKFYAMRNISKDEFLTFDYAGFTTQRDNKSCDPYTLLCFCEEISCRKNITAFHNEPKNIQDKLINQKNVLAFILMDSLFSGNSNIELIKVLPKLQFLYAIFSQYLFDVTLLIYTALFPAKKSC